VDDSEDDFYDSSTSDSLDVEGGGIPSDDGKGSAPVGAIVGGVVGGTAFLAAAAVLVCLFVTGRLKCSKCCRSSDPSAAPTPPAGHGSDQTTLRPLLLPLPQVVFLLLRRMAALTTARRRRQPLRHVTPIQYTIFHK
ncbi:unnamed protein product, partial [Ectocarpus sp. 12 AP-2014]